MVSFTRDVGLGAWKRSGKVAAYAELGFPLWGMFLIAGSRVERAAFLFQTEPNYWGSSCRMDGRPCTAPPWDVTGVEQKDWNGVQPGEFDLIGLFQYLDHLENPLAFMEELFFARAKLRAPLG